MPTATVRDVFRRRRSRRRARRAPSASLRMPTASRCTPRGAMREVQRRRSSCIAAPRTGRASLRVPRAALGIPKARLRGRSRRRTSRTDALRTPRASPRAPRGAVQEVPRRRTSCIGALRIPRASFGWASAPIGRPTRAPASPGASRGCSTAALVSRGAAPRARGRAPEGSLESAPEHWDGGTACLAYGQVPESGPVTFTYPLPVW
jgi:hypothetical protein